MGRMRELMGLVLVLVVMAGCQSNDNQLRPPKHPEEYRDPPAEDPRYSGPIQYPKELLDQDVLTKRAMEASKGAPNPLNGQRGGPGGPGGPGRTGMGGSPY